MVVLGWTVAAFPPTAGSSGGALAQAVPDTPTTPDEAAEALRRLESELRSGKASKAELDRITRELAQQVETLRDRMRETAGDVQRTEATMSRVEAQLAALEAEASGKRAALVERSSELAALTGALQRLAQRPPEELLMLNRPPLDMARTGMLLESAIPRINAEAERLKAELARLAEVEADIRDQRARLAEAGRALDGKRARLQALVDEKAGLLASTAERRAGAAERIASLTESARSLGDLLRTLEDSAAAERRAQDRLEGLVDGDRAAGENDDGATGRVALLPAAPSIAAARGRLIPPAAGRLVKRYGETDPSGLRDQGMVIAARSGALVVAPHDGRILHAGSFAGLGRILIIEHGDGYHTLIGGLGRLEVAPDQRVLAGEPIGVMTVEGGAAAEVYLELRHNGDPIDPYPWFLDLAGKAEG